MFIKALNLHARCTIYVGIVSRIFHDMLASVNVPKIWEVRERTGHLLIERVKRESSRSRKKEAKDLLNILVFDPASEAIDDLSDLDENTLYVCSISMAPYTYLQHFISHQH